MFDDHGQNIDEFVNDQVKKAIGNHTPVLKTSGCSPFWFWKDR